MTVTSMISRLLAAAALLAAIATVATLEAPGIHDAEFCSKVVLAANPQPSCRTRYLRRRGRATIQA